MLSDKVLCVGINGEVVIDAERRVRTFPALAESINHAEELMSLIFPGRLVTVLWYFYFWTVYFRYNVVWCLGM